MSIVSSELLPQQSEALKPKFELEIFSLGSSRRVEIPPGTVVLGRSASASIQVHDTSVSRSHVRLYVAEQVEVEDLGSANGTTLIPATLHNGEETTTSHTERLAAGQRVKVASGDMLRVGSVVIALRERTAAVVEARPRDADGLILVDPEMLRIYELLKRAASTEMSVLILGETGVGKELMAETVHRESQRAEQPYLKLNCAALVDSLAESELFGHDRGAFTGAHAARPGLFESADGGTVFLDEVGELSLRMQAKLLRVLEERAVIRVGSNRLRPIDVRFVTATNRNLKRQTKSGAFRADLYYRISGLVVQIPPLRKRPSEIVPLAGHFLKLAYQRAGKEPQQLSAEAQDVLVRHRWPGNVRELKHVVDRAALLAGTGSVGPEHILIDVSSDPPSRRSGAPANESRRESRYPGRPTQAPADADERARVIHALEMCGGNQTRAAKLLGLSRRTLVNRLDAYDLPRPQKGRSASPKSSRAPEQD